MSTVAEIKAAIEKLSSDEISELLIWIEEYQVQAGSSQALFVRYDEEERSISGTRRGQ